MLMPSLRARSCLRADFGIMAEARYGTPRSPSAGADDGYRTALGAAPLASCSISPACIVEAVETFERSGGAISPSACRQNAQQFSPERFAHEVAAAFADAVALQRNG
jgi:hypothetical protein